MPKKSVKELKSMIGWEGPGFKIELERGRISDFAAATELADPIYFDPIEARAQGFADLPAPPTLFGTLFYYDSEVHEPDLSFDPTQTLHGEQAFEYERVPVANEQLYGKTQLTDVFQRNGTEDDTLVGATLQTTVKDERGNLVLTSEKTLIDVS
jgi:hypothetical protein